VVTLHKSRACYRWYHVLFHRKNHSWDVFYIMRQWMVVGGHIHLVVIVLCEGRLHSIRLRNGGFLYEVVENEKPFAVAIETLLFVIHGKRK